MSKNKSKKQQVARSKKLESFKDEEIESVESDHEENKDDFFIEEEEEAKETVDEKRTRIAKEYISKLEEDMEDEGEDFISGLKSQSNLDRDEILAEILKKKASEKRGKLKYEVADSIECTETYFLKGHKKAITDFTFTRDQNQIYSVSKDCCIIEWDLRDEKTKTIFSKGEKYNYDQSGHTDEILTCAISRDSRILATAGKDRVIKLWDVRTREAIHKGFKGHEDTITSLCMDVENDQLYSVSSDRSMKIWNIRDLCYMDTHYGHTSQVEQIVSYSKDRVLSCGQDRQVIFWKIYEDTQLLYKNPKYDTSCVSCIDDSYFVTGSDNSNIDLWSFKKKKPVYRLQEVHERAGNTDKFSWVTTLDTLKNSDAFVSAGIDSTVNIYKINKKAHSLELVKKIGEPFVKGVINTVKFEPNVIAYSISGEQKMGRWMVSKPKKIGIQIQKITT